MTVDVLRAHTTYHLYIKDTSTRHKYFPSPPQPSQCPGLYTSLRCRRSPPFQSPEPGVGDTFSFDPKDRVRFLSFTHQGALLRREGGWTPSSSLVAECRL